MAIEGVPQPKEKEKKEEAAEKAGQKIASAISDAAEAVKTFMADTDDEQGHEEL